MSNFGPLLSAPVHRAGGFGGGDLSVSRPSPVKKRCRSKSYVQTRKRREKLDGSSNHPTHQPPPQYQRRPVSTFEQYTYAQGWLPDEDVYDFFSTLRRPLPVCFRIRSKKGSDEWENLLRGPLLRGLDATRVSADTNAWQIASHLDEFPVARAWIARASAQGTVSRQEFVSMIPVHLLNVQSHHKVCNLDVLFRCIPQDQFLSKFCTFLSIWLRS